MPDIFDIIREEEEAKQKKTAQDNQGTQDNQGPDYTGMDQWGNLEKPQYNNRKAAGGIGGANPEGNISGDPSVDGQAYADAVMGQSSMKQQEKRYVDPTSWSAQYAKGFWEQTKTSIMDGVADAFVTGTGHMIQAAGGISGLDSTISDGSMLSRWLVEKGEGFSEQFKSYIPEELQTENLTWSSMANPKFWSIHMAKMLPQIAEFVLISKGGSFAARKLATSAIKKYGAKGTAGVLGKASQSALGQSTMTGKGIVGALRTTEGLTKLGAGITGAVGGGITQNILAGALNAADLVNTLSEDEDADGNKIYSEEDLANMASSSMRNNLAWIGVDIASFGMTYGGGYKHLKHLAKGNKTINKSLSYAQNTKIASHLHKLDTWPAVKALAKLSGKAIPEGIEETYQETFEEWAKEKAKHDSTGFWSEGLGDVPDFMEFYNSKENKATKVLSFAAGAMGGAVFNAMNVINDKADANYKLLDKSENFKKIINKAGTKQELAMQDYFIDDTIANIVIDEKGDDVFHEFIEGAVERGNITNGENGTIDEVTPLVEKFESYKEVRKAAENLNVRGLKALMHNNSLETVSLKKIEEAKKIHESNVFNLKNAFNLSPQEEKSKIADEVTKYQNIIKGLGYTAAKANENQKNILLGKKADPLEITTTTDSFGNEILTAGLSDLGFEQLTQEDEFIGPDGKLKKTSKEGRGKITDKKALKESNKKIKELSADEEVDKIKGSDLGKTGKSFFKDLMSGLLKKNDEEAKTDDKTDDKTEVETVIEEPPANPNLDEEILTEIEKDNDVTIEISEDGNSYVAKPNKDGITAKRKAKYAQNRLDNLVEAKQQKETKKETEKETKKETKKEPVEEREDIKNKNPNYDQNETVTDEEWETVLGEPDIPEGLTSEQSDDYLREAYDKQRQIKNKILNRIADKIKAGKKLTGRENEIREQFINTLQRIIAERDLGVENNSEGEIINEEISEDDDGALDNTTLKTLELALKQEEEGLAKEEESEFRSEDAIAEMKKNIGFLKSEILKLQKTPGIQKFYEGDEKGEGLTAEEVKKKKDEKSKEWKKFNKKRAEDDGSNLDLDSREEEEESKRKIRDYNMAQAKSDAIFKSAIRAQNNSGKSHPLVSKSALDNYLNRALVYNRFGPTAVHEMAVVNHQLKVLFPDSYKSTYTDKKGNPIELKQVTQVAIVRNLFEAIGSKGVGNALAGMMYIDEKAWEQDKVFMHELSHVYLDLAWNEPETQEVIKDMLKNKKLERAIKKKYPDYILFDFNGTRMRVGELKQRLELNQEDFIKFIKEAKKKGEVENVPLEEQRYIIHEMFAAKLEGPLSKHFDKVFEQKELEIKRKKTVKMFWGALKIKGDIIAENDSFMNMLEVLNKEENVELDKDGNPNKLSKDHIFNVLKNITSSVDMSAVGLDSRADDTLQEEIDARKQFGKEKEIEYNTPEPNSSLSTKEEIERLDDLANLQEEIESSDVNFFQKDFRTAVKGSTRILKKFGIAYNKRERIRFLKKSEGKLTNYTAQNLFDRDSFESLIFELATESKEANTFGVAIEQSAVKEIQSFNKYLDAVHPLRKKTILNSMHFVISNSKHIPGFRNNWDSNGNHTMEDSLSQRERNYQENVMKSLYYSHDIMMNKIKPVDGEEFVSTFEEFRESVEKIYANKAEKKDFRRVLEMLTHRSFNFDKIMEAGILTYQGVSIPIETVISGFIKKGLPFNSYDKVKGVSNRIVLENGDIINNTNDKTRGYGPDSDFINVAAFLPLVKALINTNRKYTPFSAVMNAQNNMEPVRIVNNKLTKELDIMIEFLEKGGKKGNPASLEEFLKRYSSTAHRMKDKLGKRRYVPNQMLVGIHEQYTRSGILPTVSQYHGLKNLSNNRGSLYKTSTSTEQRIEDFLTFMNTSRTKSGKPISNYLANLGAFSDSPRKFFMNVKRIKYSDFFNPGAKGGFKNDGAMLNSLLNLHDQFYKDEINYKTTTDENGNNVMDKRTVPDAKRKLKEAIKDAINSEYEFYNDNAVEMSKVKTLSKFFGKVTDQDGKVNTYLTNAGKRMIAEYVMNSIMHGYNVADVFSPGIQGKNIVKRFKGNSSPVFSVKNPNFKTEFIFVADTIENNGVAGTDSGMYISQKSAERLQRLGKGVFNMNGGFKLLNSSVERDNPNFEGQSAYMKGYTTVVMDADTGHPFHALLAAREKKYEEWYQKQGYGNKPSMDLSDGSHNHMAIIIPQSADKSDFSFNKFGDFLDESGINETTGEKEFDSHGNPIIKYTKAGEKFTADALQNKDNFDAAMKKYDELYYDKKGEFVGLDTYNFGPQQLMDKETEKANVGVQLVNSIMVNAGINNKLELAEEIQQHISNQKAQQLQKVLDKIKDKSISQYKALIMESLNLEDMNQAQRILLQDNGSIAHPYVNDIIVNQLIKTIRREGNTFQAPGSLSHQKPDTGYQFQAAHANKHLKGYSKAKYSKNGKGLRPAEIMLAGHMETMENKPFARQLITYDNEWGKRAIQQAENSLGKRQRKMMEAYRKRGEKIPFDMLYMESAAVDMAKKRHKDAIEELAKDLNISVDEAALNFVDEQFNEKKVKIGYHVKGQTIMASRVPGDGPSSTGIFEVVGFDKGIGNQAMVSADFNQIIGSDNDGDALFINMKGKDNKEYGEWNQAFDKMVKYWLSEDMEEQVQARMIFEKRTQKMVNEIDETYKTQDKYVMPNSPQQRAIDYNNTQVSKRNVGPVFATHKITNLLASYGIRLTKSFRIGDQEITQFKDKEKGSLSRNHQSAILANIILDNAKHGYADAIGLDEHNVSQAVLLVNLGIELKDVGLILRSPAAQLWSKYQRNNNSEFHEYKNISTIVKKIKSDLKLNKKNYSLNVNPKQAHIKTSSTQGSILALLEHLSEMNSDIQKMSKIMSGHKAVHVNPLVLEQQLKEFKDVIYKTEEIKSTLMLDEKFRNNPDLKNYVDVAEKALIHLKKVNPVYNETHLKILKRIVSMIDGDLSSKQIEEISKDLMRFSTSRLLGLNNIDKKYVKNLLDPKHKDSIFKKINKYLRGMDDALLYQSDEKPVKDSINKRQNSLLFARALNWSTDGNVQFISANSQFVNDSFNEEERIRAQQEWEQLPKGLKDDLILYDMIKHGWKGPQSMSPFFGKNTNSIINQRADQGAVIKNEALDEKVLEQLENIVALKASFPSNNPFVKVYVKGGEKVLNNRKKIIKLALENKNIRNKLIQEQKPFYINVRNSNWDGINEDDRSVLYKLDELTPEEIITIQNATSANNKLDYKMELAQDKLNVIPAKNYISYTFNEKSVKNSNNKWEKRRVVKYQPDIDLATISDSNTGEIWKTKNKTNNIKDLNPLEKARIKYQQLNAKKGELGNQMMLSFDARESYDEPMFNRKSSLSPKEFAYAKEYNRNVTTGRKKLDYEEYLISKKKANRLAKTITPESLISKSQDELLDMYSKYGKEDAYAYSVIMTPIIKELANKLIEGQMKLHKNIEFDGKDISAMKAMLMSGSTTPSNHPASQAMVRVLEAEYKKFIDVKKKYMQSTRKVTEALYKEKLGYDGSANLTSWKGLKNTVKKIRDTFITGRQNVYQKLYGNLVDRTESINDAGKLVTDFKLKTVNEIEKAYKSGRLSKAEYDFYNHFRKTTAELKPDDLNNPLKGYIPHTSMTMLETLSSRGLLGLMANARNDDEAIMDVQMSYKDENGEIVMMPFSKITDLFKIKSAGEKKNNIETIVEYRKLKSKAKKLLKSGKNENGTKLVYSPVGIDTVLGFGAVNRFSNGRSVKSTELPSMDLNKALGDYIHSSLFVNGGGDFKGMQKLSGYIDGVLAFNRENNLPNMNSHVQKVWKDYFLRGKRQTSVLGKKADRVILGLTRLNLFYALGYKANVNTKGTYAWGNILAGKYHNIKDIGGKAWLKGEARFWGLDKGFSGGPQGVMDRHKRMQNIMKTINYMEINVYDEVNMEKKNGLDTIFTDLALQPMIQSEKWIQQTHLIGMMTEEQLNKFDDNGNYKNPNDIITPEELIILEDRVKGQHGRGYQPSDQRAVQMYSWGTMLMQFARFLPTLINDRFAKEDVNIYGQENIGTLRAVGKMVRNVVNDPGNFIKYRNSLSEEQRQKLDSGLKGMAMSTVLSLFNAATDSETGSELWFDVNYYLNYPKLTSKAVPSAIQSTNNLVSSMF